MVLNNIEAIAVDMDGTLLNDNHKILPKTKEALIECQKQGIELIIATGRPLNMILPYIDEIKLREYGGLIISNNGALIYDAKNEKIIFEESISVEEAKTIFNKLKKYTKLYPFYVDKNNLYVHDRNEAVFDTGSAFGGVLNWHEMEAKIGGYRIVEKEDLAESLNSSLLKIMASGEASYLTEIQDELTKNLQGLVRPMKSLPFVFEFAKEKISKGSALEKLNFDFDKLITFGDGMNDYHMIEIAKYGVAMGNAADDIKNIAYEITDTNNEEGIYKFLLKHGIVGA